MRPPRIREVRLSRGKCGTCGARPNRPGKTECAQCAAHANLREKMGRLGVSAPEVSIWECPETDLERAIREAEQDLSEAS